MASPTGSKSGANLPGVWLATAPFDYVGLHGADQHHLYAGSYPDGDLRGGPTAFGEWSAQGREMFNCFNNDRHGHGVRKAETLPGMLRC